jgi:hypothetical protein
VIIGVVLAALLAAPADAPPSDRDVQLAIGKGIAFLLSDQNRDGSWGGPRDGSFNDLWDNPETHRAWTIGTTGLATMALIARGSDDPSRAAADRALVYLADSGSLRRCSDWDLDDVWGYVYGLQGIARALSDARIAASPIADRLRAAGKSHVDRLLAMQSFNGGWGYYAWDESAFRPYWSTSFTTAAALLALLDAKSAGFAVPDRAIARAAKALEQCRLPTGAFTYTVSPIPSPGSMEGIDQVKSAIGRIQVCDLALRRAGRPMSDADLARGLDLFFEHQRFFDVGRKRSIPHEAYYAVAGYFYYFGQYYAAEVLAALPPEARRARADRFLAHLIGTQEANGSMWDYVMHHYCRAYGTAYGVLALGLGLDARR